MATVDPQSMGIKENYIFPLFGPGCYRVAIEMPSGCRRDDRNIAGVREKEDEERTHNFPRLHLSYVLMDIPGLMKGDAMPGFV